MKNEPTNSDEEIQQALTLPTTRQQAQTLTPPLQYKEGYSYSLPILDGTKSDNEENTKHEQSSRESTFSSMVKTKVRRKMATYIDDLG